MFVFSFNTLNFASESIMENLAGPSPRPVTLPIYYEESEQAQERPTFCNWLFSSSTYKKIHDFSWLWLAVRSAKYVPMKFQTTKCCIFLTWSVPRLFDCL